MDTVKLEQSGIESLLTRLELPLDIRFVDGRDRQQTAEIIAVADWGAYRCSKFADSQIKIADLVVDRGVTVNPTTDSLLLWGAKLEPNDRQTWHGLVRYGVCAYLCTRGYTPIHAACAIDPEGRAWLIAGSTHTGKSTLIIGLLEAGWQFLGDDSLILSGVGERIVAHGWLGTSLIDPILSDTFLHLQSYLGEPVGKRKTLDIHRCYGDRWVERAEPQGILFPHFDSQLPDAKLQAVSRGETLGNLTDHVAQWLSIEPQIHLSTLQRLTYQCVAFKLGLGSTLRSQPNLVGAIITVPN